MDCFVGKCVLLTKTDKDMTKLRTLLSQRFPALASRDFAIFWVGHLFSLIGTSMQNTALPLLAYRISGHPLTWG
jgi:hypothetical protein